MADLIFDNVMKRFDGGVVAVDDFTLTIASPSMTVLVGPSGCGKTTLLRMVAGLETPTSGTIHLGERRLDTLEPRHRDVAMVFQNYALYPHMSVSSNLSFGLRLRKMPKPEIARRVADVAKALEIDALLERKPAELSGGQRQRVALGRAIIREPQVFLFDEPLSNLDARLRSEMRATIKTLYERLKVTSIYVTHDQVEAMTIGEQLVVMNDGRVRQVGTPEVCYHRPADTFVASFLGSPAMNLLGARRQDTSGALHLDDGGTVDDAVAARAAGAAEVTIGFRPEHVRSRPTGAASVQVTGQITLVEPLGHETLTHFRVGERVVIARGSHEFAGTSGDSASLYIDADDVHVFGGPHGARMGDN